MAQKEFTDEERAEIEEWVLELADLMGKHFLKPPNEKIMEKVKDLRKKIESKGLHISWSIEITDFKKMEGKADVTVWIPEHITIQ